MDSERTSMLTTNRESASEYQCTSSRLGFPNKQKFSKPACVEVFRRSGNFQ